ncbi:unnamed protein product [Zymoseptoria tritici ST99CH_3D1]|nr:unnamed protein product [Zymoseptoria tritici ST99CH_3D1]
MSKTWNQPSQDALVKSLWPLYPGEDEATNTSQLRHRLNLLQTWFGDLTPTPKDLQDASILEIGCGQGDMTIPLAHFAGHVDAVDPAPLDYGSPFTLGQAQAQLSKHFGDKIRWIQQDPMDYIRSQKDSQSAPDVVVLAHSIFYFASEEYLSSLLRELRAFGNGHNSGSLKLVVAEWGMRATNPAAEAHVLAAKAQAPNPLPDGNVRLVVTPEEIRRIAADGGWKLAKEHWIESPELDDGQWEVCLARDTRRNGEEAPLLDEMERAVKKLEGKRVAAMDVWTAVFTI